MAKANFKCECGKTQTIVFNPGEKIADPICECGKHMKRAFGAINVGYIEEDDILRAGFMMTYHSKSNESR